MPKKSKNALDGEIITIHRGLAIYKVNASPYWQARIRDPRIRRYVVRSTEETSRIKAKQVARELAFDLLGAEKRVEREYTFRHYATRLMAKGERLVANGVPELISARFLFEYLSTFKDELLVTRMTGTANVTLSIGRIAEVPVPLVPPAAQRKGAHYCARQDGQSGTRQAGRLHPLL